MTNSIVKLGVAVACTALVLLPACSEAPAKPNPTRAVVAVPQLPAELGEKWDAENDAQTEEIRSTVTQMLADRTQGDSFVRRDAHPKHHGCVTASVRIDSNSLPRELRVGVFSPDSRTEYPAWIRFSNGNPDATRPDIDKDIRGMAVKLMNVGITIPRQGDIDSTGQMNACENLSFDPWRGRPETRHLGQVNRMRLAIYPAVASLRHDFNHVPDVEPRSHDICGDETASRCRAPKH